MSAPARDATRRAAAPSLLLELGTEELPPKALRSLGIALAAALHEALQDAGLLGADSGQGQRWFATPRRLAVLIPGVLTRQSDHVVERRGPALSAAFDATGAPTKAALGFARSCGVPVEQLERIESEKGSWLGYREIRRGNPRRSSSPTVSIRRSAAFRYQNA